MQYEFSAARLTEPKHTTGIVEAVPDLSVEVQRGQPRPQAVDEDGQRLWTVEVMDTVTEWGRRRTEVFTVRVPAPQQPVLEPGLARFKDLKAVVSTRVNKQGSGRDSRIVGVSENVYWDARGVEQVRGQSSAERSA